MSGHEKRIKNFKKKRPKKDIGEITEKYSAKLCKSDIFAKQIDLGKMLYSKCRVKEIYHFLFATGNVEEKMHKNNVVKC